MTFSRDLAAKNIRRAVFLALVLLSALFFPQGGLTQSPCIVERGLDPLDVLNVGVRHNVWLVLDTSGSMAQEFQGGSAMSKLDTAKDVIGELLTELVDSSGLPLVNWGFVHFDENPDNGTFCRNPFQIQCQGLKAASLINPPACGGPDNRDQILATLAQAQPEGFTPNGKALDQASNGIQTNFVPALLPDQKNFVIMMTDGDDTCECRFTVWDEDLSGAETNLPAYLRSQSGTPDPTKQVSNQDDRRGYNAGLKGRLAYTRLNPSATDQSSAAKGDVFVVGMDLGNDSKARANHLAWEASGTAFRPDAHPAFFADDPAQLKKALRDILANIGVPEAEVTLGAPVVGTVKEVIALAEPGVHTSDIVGDVSPPDVNDVREARVLRSQYRSNVLFTTSVETPSFHGHLRAFNVYSVLDVGLPTERREGDFTEVWDAGEVLRDRDPDERTILFNRRGETLLREFTAAELTAADLGVGAGFLAEVDGTGARSVDDAIEIVVKVIRGYRLSIDPLTDTIYNVAGELNFSKTDENGDPTWKLYDATNVGPTVALNPPRPPDIDPPQFHGLEYGIGSFPDGFYWEHLNRQTMVYLGTNGGMMHGFRADSGAELFAYIPDDVLGLDSSTGEIPGSRSTLKDLVTVIVTKNNGIHNHNFFLAGSATVEDVFLRSPLGDDEWHTVLAFGRGRGGRFLTALDITNIGDWDENPSNASDRLDPEDPDHLPKLLFNRGNRDGIDDGIYDGLGETWSVPVMGNVRTADGDQWVLFAGAGYGCVGTTEGRFLYVLSLEDGTVYRRLDLPNDDPEAPIDHNALVASPRLFSPHQPYEPNDYVTRAYIGDLQGFVYKLDTSDADPLNWTFEELFALGLDQPITAPVSLLHDPFKRRVYVFVGTGGDRRVTPTADSPFLFAGILDADPDGANNPGQAIQVPDAGDFLIDLPAEERVQVAPVTVETADGVGAVYFASSKSELDLSTCASQFYSTLFAFEAATGLGSYDLDPDASGDQSSVDIGAGKVTGLYHRDEHLYVGKSGGIGVDSELEVRGEDEFPIPALGGNGIIQVTMDGFRYSAF